MKSFSQCIYLNGDPLNRSIRLGNVYEFVLKQFVGPGESFAASGTHVLLQALVDFFDVSSQFVLF